MKSADKKRYAILAGLVAVMLLAGYLNFALNNQAGEAAQQAELDINDEIETMADDGASAGTNFFAAFRSERDAVRETEISFLDSIIQDDVTDKETLKEAQQKKLALADAMEKEMIIEGLIKAKGFKDSTVTINGESVNVVLDATELESAQVAMVLDIVQRETDISAENIKVMPKE